MSPEFEVSGFTFALFSSMVVEVLDSEMVFFSFSVAGEVEMAAVVTVVVFLERIVVPLVSAQSMGPSSPYLCVSHSLHFLKWPQVN